MKILLAVDGSAHNKAVVDKIAGRLFPPGTKVRIVAAYERAARIMTLDTMGVSKEYYAEADRNALKAAMNMVENAEEVFRKKAPALSITKAAIEGSPKTVILEEAGKFDADLIIVGSHGYGYVERFLIGSVSQAVSLHAKCSVEIVRIKNINSKEKTKTTKK